MPTDTNEHANETVPASEKPETQAQADTKGTDQGGSTGKLNVVRGQKPPK